MRGAVFGRPLSPIVDPQVAVAPGAGAWRSVRQGRCEASRYSTSRLTDASGWMRRQPMNEYVGAGPENRLAEGRNMLAAGGIGIIGIIVVVLIVLAIVYFVRRS
jgi:hypothetical protein